MANLNHVISIRVNKEEYNEFCVWCGTVEKKPYDMIRKLVKEATKNNIVVKGNSKIKRVFK